MPELISIPAKETGKKYFFIVIACILMNGALLAQAPTNYRQEIEDWHARRIKTLKAPDGWLDLVGLYWLDDGKNSFGSGGENKVIFPAGTIAASAGYFERTGSRVKIVAWHDAGVKINDTTVTEAVIFDKDIARPPVVSAGSLRWTIIRREDKIGVRVRDLESPLLRDFKDIDRFPVDTTWRIKAVLQAEGQPQVIAITNILGQTSRQQTPGKLVFTVNSKQYSLDALGEGDELFVIFADETSGKMTYPSGRFLSVKKPSADGTTIIDFNKAYNPPCAFTNYATCPLPPAQNVLPIAVTAGEKNYGHH